MLMLLVPEIHFFGSLVHKHEDIIRALNYERECLKMQPGTGCLIAIKLSGIVLFL